MFKWIVFFSAISVALVAAYFSVTGIATLFYGRYWAVLVMAASLELGKLVVASFLYRTWSTTGRFLKSYMIVAVAILMAITSIGIYGYLSAGYAEVAAVPQNTINQLSALDIRQTTLNDNVARRVVNNRVLEARREQVQLSLDNVLAGNTELSQRSAFANLRNEIEELDAERRINSGLIETTQLELYSLENLKVTLRTELNTNSEIGTFIYIARILGLPLDTVVKWFVLIIVFVFDPLAISLILAYNSIVVKEKKRSPGRHPWKKLKMKNGFTIEEWQKKRKQESPPDHDDFDRLQRFTLKGYKKGLDRSRNWSFSGIKRFLDKKRKCESKLSEQEKSNIHFHDGDCEPVDETRQRTEDSNSSQETKQEQPDLTEFVSVKEIEQETTKPELHYNVYHDVPYYLVENYDWEGNRNVWEKDPRAVEYYRSYIYQARGH